MEPLIKFPVSQVQALVRGAHGFDKLGTGQTALTIRHESLSKYVKEVMSLARENLSYLGRGESEKGFPNGRAFVPSVRFTLEPTFGFKELSQSVKLLEEERAPEPLVDLYESYLNELDDSETIKLAKAAKSIRGRFINSGEGDEVILERALAGKEDWRKRKLPGRIIPTITISILLARNCTIAARASCYAAAAAAALSEQLTRLGYAVSIVAVMPVAFRSYKTRLIYNTEIELKRAEDGVDLHRLLSVASPVLFRYVYFLDYDLLPHFRGIYSTERDFGYGRPSIDEFMEWRKTELIVRSDTRNPFESVPGRLALILGGDK